MKLWASSRGSCCLGWQDVLFVPAHGLGRGLEQRMVQMLQEPKGREQVELVGLGLREVGEASSRLGEQETS